MAFRDRHTVAAGSIILINGVEAILSGILGDACLILEEVTKRVCPIKNTCLHEQVPGLQPSCEGVDFSLVAAVSYAHTIAAVVKRQLTVIWLK